MPRDGFRGGWLLCFWFSWVPKKARSTHTPHRGRVHLARALHQANQTGIAPHDAMADEEAAPARPLRAARLRSAPARASARVTFSSGPSGRPTAAENDEAEELIDAMRQGVTQHPP